MWRWRRMEIMCTDNVGNEKVLRRVKEDRNTLKTIKRKEGRTIGLVTSCVGTAF
jgi:hypothetical protein